MAPTRLFCIECLFILSLYHRYRGIIHRIMFTLQYPIRGPATGLFCLITMPAPSCSTSRDRLSGFSQSNSR